MTTWIFDIPRPILFGVGSIDSIGSHIAHMGARAAVITGRAAMRRTGILDRVLTILSESGVQARPFEEIPPEPTYDAVDAATTFARSITADAIIGVGGGSVMDVAKVAAFLAPSTHPVRALYEGVPVDRKGLPCVLVPTTAGTGSEMTPNSVFTDPETRIKSSVRGKPLVADLVICDPALTTFAPPHVTAYAGMDALTQAIESYVSRGANPFTDAFARSANHEVELYVADKQRNPFNMEKAAEHVVIPDLNIKESASSLKTTRAKSTLP